MFRRSTLRSSSVTQRNFFLVYVKIKVVEHWTRKTFKCAGFGWSSNSCEFVWLGNVNDIRFLQSELRENSIEFTCLWICQGESSAIEKVMMLLHTDIAQCLRLQKWRAEFYSRYTIARGLQERKPELCYSECEFTFANSTRSTFLRVVKILEQR